MAHIKKLQRTGSRTESIIYKLPVCTCCKILLPRRGNLQLLHPSNRLLAQLVAWAVRRLQGVRARLHRRESRAHVAARLVEVGESEPG